jgi:hypothetical protein
MVVMIAAAVMMSATTATSAAASTTRTTGTTFTTTTLTHVHVLRINSGYGFDLTVPANATKGACWGCGVVPREVNVAVSVDPEDECARLGW